MDNITDINTKQAYWLRTISENDNFYKSLTVTDRSLIHRLLVCREYNDIERLSIIRIRHDWIRYIKLNNNKDI